MVVKSREELYALLGRGFKPYWHKAVRRWYLRRGQVRHIIDRGLEAEVEAIAQRLGPPRRVSMGRVAEAIRMRAEGLPIPAVIGWAGVKRSTLYGKLEEYEERKIEPQAVEGPAQGLPFKEVAPAKPTSTTTAFKGREAPQTPTSTPNVEEGRSTPQELNMPSAAAETTQSLFASLNEGVKRFERIISKPKNAEAILKIIDYLGALGNLLVGLYLFYNEKDKTIKALLAKEMKDIIERYERRKNVGKYL
jgi:hypothetical protein